MVEVFEDSVVDRICSCAGSFCHVHPVWGNSGKITFSINFVASVPNCNHIVTKDVLFLNKIETCLKTTCKCIRIIVRKIKRKPIIYNVLIRI